MAPTQRRSGSVASIENPHEAIELIPMKAPIPSETNRYRGSGHSHLGSLIQNSKLPSHTHNTQIVCEAEAGPSMRFAMK